MKKILLMAFTASVMLGACKKDKNAEPKVEQGCPVATYHYSETEGGSTYEEDPYTLGYDTQGRIISINNGTYSTAYTYLDGTIVEETDNGSATYTLNSEGKITGMTALSNYGGDNSVVVNKYNAQGYLSELKYNDENYSSTTTFIYTDGELTRMEETTVMANSTYTNVTQITYKNEYSKNALAYAETFPYIADISTGGDTRTYLNVLGKSNKRLINTVTVSRTGSNSFNVVKSYSYEKDASGNVTKVGIISAGSNSSTISHEFTYNCN
jgi:YD repeat-containing protein